MASRDCDEVWNRPRKRPRFQLMHPVERVPICGVNYVPSYSVPRFSEHPMASSSTSIPPFGFSTSGLSHQTYSIQSTSNPTSFLTSCVQHESSLSPFRMHNEEFGYHGRMINGNGACNRKAGMPLVYDSHNSSGHFNRDSSYNYFQWGPVPDTPHRSWNSVNNMHSSAYGGEHSWQGSSKNLRHHHSDAAHFISNSARSHFPSHSDMVRDLPCMGTERHWSSLAPVSSSRWVTISEPGAFTSRANLQPSESSHRNILHVNEPHHISVPCRGFSYAFAARGPVIDVGASSSNHDQRAAPPCRPMWGPHLPHEVGMPSLSGSGSGRQVHADPYRRPMAVSINGGQHHWERSETIRDSYHRFRSDEVMVGMHGRWRSQGVVLDRGLLFDDQHQGMRLDIDNMSYEELLALGERIGNVNTGLSKDMISTCLTRVLCSSLTEDQDDDSGKCAICLEIYKVQEEMGYLKCGHGYHFCCIKKWLEIKNSCPICKASALEK